MKLITIRNRKLMFCCFEHCLLITRALMTFPMASEPPIGKRKITKTPLLAPSFNQMKYIMIMHFTAIETNIYISFLNSEIRKTQI